MRLLRRSLFIRATHDRLLILSSENVSKRRAMILMMGFEAPNRKTEQVVGIVASEAALGMNIFRDIANSVRDIVGGRANSAQATLKEARTACLEELKREAAQYGADAVIAVDLDYNELSAGATGGIVFVAATGTAVKLAPIEHGDEAVG